jgi:glycosyltransferase involved in cell wall biosynthesis
MRADSVSVIVRCKDKADTIEATFASIREQTIPSEIVVVDSGSTDGTLAIARRWADRTIEIPPRDFSYGRSLNVGADAADGTVHAAVSAHVTLPHPQWLARAVEHVSRDGVAAASGQVARIDGGVLLEPVYQELEDWMPTWGFANTAAAWRADVWQEHQFDEVMTACEDKEWAWRVLRAGWSVAIDPRLAVSSIHRRRAGIRDLLRRCSAETRELVLRTNTRPVTARDAISRWWGDVTRDEETPALLQRLSYFRMTEIAGSYLGSRQAIRRERRDTRV